MTKTPVAVRKLAQQRLGLLELAKILGNVSEACKQRGVCRAQFYEYKKRFQTHGIEGLKDLPPIHKSHPMTTPPETVKKILEFSLEHPSWGANRLSAELKYKQISVSGPTIQNILAKNGMGSRYDRWLKLEEIASGKKIPLNATQVKEIEKFNPCFKERHVESAKPGELLSQDTFYVGSLKGVGRVYMQGVVDTHGSFAFAYVHIGKVPENAALILHNDVLPQYKRWGIPVKAVLTDNGREYRGREEQHPYEIYLGLNDIEHRLTKVKSPRTNGFVERFNRTVLDEFFRPAFRTKLYTSLKALQKDLDKWLYHYNHERAHLGYRNMGKRPIDTVLKFAKLSTKKVN